LSSVRQEVGELPSCHHGVIGSQEGCSLQKYKDPSASRCQGVGLLPSRYRDLCYKWKEETMVGIGRYHSGTSTLAALASAGNGRGSDHFLDSITGCVWRLVRSSAGCEIMVIGAAHFSVQTLERRSVRSWSLCLAVFTLILAFTGSEVA
jgi:hypothetical protein